MEGAAVITAVALAGAAAVLAWAAWTDHRTRRIPNAAVAGLAGIWLLWRLGLGAWASWGAPGSQSGAGSGPAARFLAGAWDGRPLGLPAAPDGLLAAAAFGAGLLAFALAFEALAKKEALGGGDVKLMAALALFLGPGRSAVCLLVACVMALASVAAGRSRAPRDGADAVQGPQGAQVPQGVQASQASRGAQGSQAPPGPPGTFAFGPALAIGAVVALMPGTNFFLIG